MFRTGGEASQGMAMIDDRRDSTFATAIDASDHFLLSVDAAEKIVRDVIATVARRWDDAATSAGLTRVDRRALERNTVLGDFSFRGREDLRAN